MSTHVSGLAASIRASTESTTFDLANQNSSTITSTIQSAFAEPFPLSQMIRITFVTGAGKLGRQKYDDNAAKSVTSTLRDLGFEEDRGASCVNDCAGSFKLQHDTGKNLKTVVVFPLLSGGDGNGKDKEGGVLGGTTAAPFEKNSIDEKLATSSLPLFMKMMASQCPSWTQKKECLARLSSITSQVAELDTKLLSGQLLTEMEQAMYDAVGTLDELNEKNKELKKSIQEMVQNGQLTHTEKDTLLDHVSTRLSTLDKEIKSATDEKKPKLLSKLKAQREVAMERQKHLQDVTPKPPHPLKKEKEIGVLRKEMRPLTKLEESAKGRLLTMKETKALGRKEEIWEEIEQLEEASRGWFETDQDFSSRVTASRAAHDAEDHRAATAKSKKLSASGSSKQGGFVSAGNKKKVTTAWLGSAPTKKTVAKPKKTGGGGGGGVFARMMMDSDSD